MIDRYDFYERYGVRPKVIYNLDIGQIYENDKKKLRLEVKDHLKNEDTGFYDTITFFDGKDILVVDLAAHWERHPEDGKEYCHEGVVSLVQAVYARAEEDYEGFYLNGDEEIDIKPMPGESLKEFQQRRYKLYKEAVDECEEFLGKLFVKYSKVKALWSKTHDPNVMALKINESPERIACIIDRLGLNRSDSPTEDECDNRTVKLSSDFDRAFLTRI